VSLTYAMFSWYDDRWHYYGMTLHDEAASEFEDIQENEVRQPHRVVALETPDIAEIKRYADLIEEDVEVRGELL